MPSILIAEKEFSPSAKKILGKAGQVLDYDSTEGFLRDLPRADAVVTGLEIKFNKTVLDKAPRLKLIGSRTTQLRYLDLDECRKRGIKIVNIKTRSPVLKKTYSTAEEAIALTLALLRNIPWAFEAIKKGAWERKKYGGHELMGKIIGLIGLGRLGKMVANYSRVFGMKVLAFDPYVDSIEIKKHQARKVGLDYLLKNSDIVSLHSVYNESTRGFIKERHFELMKKNAVFINTARGEITDELALLKALKNNWIAGAALDTLAGEAPDGSHLIDNPLVNYAREHQNLIIVPHLGGATREATERTQKYISELVVKEIKSWRKK